jgi:hypothetical protein
LNADLIESVLIFVSDPDEPIDPTMHNGAVFVKGEGCINTFGFSVAASATPRTSSLDAAGTARSGRSAVPGCEKQSSVIKQSAVRLSCRRQRTRQDNGKTSWTAWLR